MQKTTNYGLPQWVADDQIRMDDFNAAFAALDAALRSQSDAALSGLNAETAAREEAVSAEASARANALSALQAVLSAAIGSGGRTCRICTGSYTGTGSGKVSNPVSIPCPFYPVLVFVQGENAARALPMLRIQDTMQYQQDFNLVNSTLRVMWADASVSWYSDSSGTSTSVAESSGNTRDEVYHYVIIGFDNTGTTE